MPPTLAPQANDALLCGRVLLFLARCLPLADKSGVNQGCLFNERLPLALDDVPEGATDTNGQPIDGAFYRTFWGLQQQLAVGGGAGGGAGAWLLWLLEAGLWHVLPTTAKAAVRQGPPALASSTSAVLACQLCSMLHTPEHL